MSLDFPWQMFEQATEAKNRNRRQAMEDAQGIGQNIGGVTDSLKQLKQKQLMNQLVQAMQTQGGPMAPVRGPAGYAPPNQGQQSTAIPAGQTPPGKMDNSQQIQSLMMQMNPEIYMKDIYPKTLKKQMGGVGKRVVYQNPDGSVSLTPTEGATPLEVSDAQAMQYTAIPKSSKAKNDALGGRAEAMQRGIDAKQIDLLIARTGLTPKQQSSLQMNNQRAARALQILSNPKITWQELALGEIDLTGIMQGGVPVRDEIVATHFPGWQQQAAQWKTYATGHPVESVPDAIKQKVYQMVNGVVQVDNRILNANAKFSKKMLAPTIRGGLKPSQVKSIDEMTGVLTTPLPPEKAQEDYSNMSTEELQRIAAGGR